MTETVFEPDGELLLVVPTFGHFDYVVRTLDTAVESHAGVRVLIVDDGSPDWPGDEFFLALAPGRVACHRFPKNDRNITRSWNHGARLARAVGMPYVAFGNSDLKFPAGWWPPIRDVLADERLHLAGPLTNAPGHRRLQLFSRYVRHTYPLGTVPPVSDDDKVIAAILKSLSRRFGARPEPMPGHINGFLMAGRMDILWRYSHDGEHVLNPSVRYKMIRSEDELCGRWITRGLRVGAVPNSFVFHYRGVSRPEGRRGPQADGLFRPNKGT